MRRAPPMPKPNTAKRFASTRTMPLRTTTSAPCWPMAWEARTTRTADAEAEFREAIRLDPNYAKAHYNLGLFLHCDGSQD
jgi:hypothetical protein